MSVRSTRKVKKDRKSPETTATLYPEGTIEFGKDSERWVVKQTKAGIKRWIPYYSTSLFGYAPLTAKILENHINKSITVYERQSDSVWPKSTRDFDVKYSFIASGDAELLKKNDYVKEYSNWLKTKTPAVKDGQYVIIKGTMRSNDIEGKIQVAPLPGELVSSNLMNTDAFVKVESV